VGLVAPAMARSPLTGKSPRLVPHTCSLPGRNAENSRSLSVTMALEASAVLPGVFRQAAARGGVWRELRSLYPDAGQRLPGKGPASGLCERSACHHLSERVFTRLSRLPVQLRQVGGIPVVPPVPHGTLVTSGRALHVADQPHQQSVQVGGG
jgi:hypothetical protein